MAIYKYTVVAAEDEELLLGNLVKKIEQTGLGFRVIGTLSREARLMIS